MDSPALAAVALALVSALFYAASNTLVRAGIERATPTTALFVSLTTNVVVLWALALTLSDVTVSLWEWRYFVAAGAFAPMLGRFFNYSGIERLGMNVSVPIVFTNPVFTVVIAMLFFGELVTVVAGLGVLASVVGAVIIGTERDASERTAVTPVKKRYLLLPLAGAFFYGSSHVFREIGVSLVPDPVLAAAVTATTSWLLLAAALAFRREHVLHSVARRELAFFAAAGVATSVAIPSIYLAYQYGSVVVVTPVTNASPLFLLGFSYLFFRGEEVFSARVVTGTVFIVAGVVVLSLFGGV